MTEYIAEGGCSYTELTATLKSTKCEICEQPGHGTHFGAFTCRACAAFFRRSSLHKKNYTCRNNKKKCRIAMGERYLCRYCRYQKCLGLGMTEERIQLNRDPFISSENVCESSPSSSSSDSPDTKKTINNEEDVIDPKFKIIFDTSIPKAINGKSGLFLLSTFRHIFATFKPEEMVEEPIKNDLHGMVLALRRYRFGQRRKTMLFEYLLFTGFTHYWETQQVRLSEWLMFSKEFREMEVDDKLCLLFNGRYAFRRIERLHMSLLIYGESFFEDRIYVVTDDVSLRYGKLKFDETKPEITKIYKELFRLTAPNEDKIIEDVAKPLFQLQLTEMEFTYLLCQFMFHVEGTEISQEAQEAAINFKNRISNDMHNYYTNELKMENYCNRLIDIMNVVNTWERLMFERSRILEMAHLFDVTGHDLSGVF